jgi:hypothetical protein
MTLTPQLSLAPLFDDEQTEAADPRVSAILTAGLEGLPDSFRGSRGTVRLGLVRNAMDWSALEGGTKADGWASPGRDLICQAYAAWVGGDDYLLMAKREGVVSFAGVLGGNVSGIPLGSPSVSSVHADPAEASSPWGPWVTFAVKARKRGNDLDVKRSKERLSPVYDDLIQYVGPNGARLCPVYFSSTRPELRGEGYTSLLFVTLTWNPAICDRYTAWTRIGEDFNRFRSSITKTFCGPTTRASRRHPAKHERVHVVRSWECFENGYPHVHVLLAFDEVRFKVWKDVSKEGYVKWRIDDEDRRVFGSMRGEPPGKGAWHSWVDVQAIYGEDGEHEVRKSVNNVVWYVLKGQDSDYSKMKGWSYKGLLTRAMLWFFRKRSWSAPRAMIGPPRRLDSGPCTVQTGAPVETVFLGMIERSSTELGIFDWVKIYPEPPPWLGRGWCPGSASKWSKVRGHGYRSRGTVETPASRWEELCRKV